jgi:putative ABC transport system permease protein
MLAYYVELAIRSLHRSLVLTALMIAIIGVGIGTSMTMLTTLIAMSSNPVPDKSSQLFVPQIDVTGNATRAGNVNWIPPALPYRDAMALMRAGLGTRQTAMYPIALNVTPSQGDPFEAAGRATYAEFFSMFEVPFRSGTAWRHQEDAEGGNLVVLSANLADRLFPRQNAVGATITLGDHNYRVSGVLRQWTPTPRFYDVDSHDFSSDAFVESEDFYLPFSTGINRHIETTGYAGCEATAVTDDWSANLNSDCAWIQFWVELPRAAQVRAFKTFLENYAAEQQRSGRFQWLPLVALHDVMDWLTYRHVVPNEVRVNALIATGFLVVCLINAVGLLLAKFAARARDLGVRRALGASRINIFFQCVTEALVIGLLGGGIGLALTAGGLWGVRAVRDVASSDSALRHLISLNIEMVVITLATAIIATTCSGLYPALRASRVQPARLLKAQWY